MKSASATIVIANWKTMVTTPAKARALVASYKKVPVQFRKGLVVCPPAPFLSIVHDARLVMGAQGVSSERAGATTGHIPAEILSEIGVDYVIVGHSEERARGVTSQIVNQQIVRLLEYGITPVVCVGESSRQEMHGFQELRTMLVETFAKLSKIQIEKCIIAYEPVWAIGASAHRAATPDEVHEALLFCKKVLTMDVMGERRALVRMIYGGSVDSTNAHSYTAIDGVSGLLVGRTSVDAREFAKLLRLV